MSKPNLAQLLTDIRACQICAKHLPHPPRPVLQASKTARLMIIGQAPGRRVQESGIPWNDRSGDKLREWLQLTPEQFYDQKRVAIVPAGFCYPGTSKHGDLPPRPECAPLWHPQLFAALPEIKLTLLVGSYAQRFYLKEPKGKNLTDTVKSFATHLPKFFPLPHPSPRNQIWLRHNPWFDNEVLPQLRAQASAILRA